MKQKNKKLDLVTKGFLKKELKQFEKRFDQKLTVLEVRTDIKFDSLERRIDENARKYRDQILSSNDKIAKDLEGMREDKIIGSDQTARLQNQVDNHEKRIGKIEHIQQAA